MESPHAVIYRAFLSDKNVINLAQVLGIPEHVHLIKEKMSMFAQQRVPDIRAEHCHDVKKCVMALNIDFVRKVKERRLYSTPSGVSKGITDRPQSARVSKPSYVNPVPQQPVVQVPLQFSCATFSSPFEDAPRNTEFGGECQSDLPVSTQVQWGTDIGTDEGTDDGTGFDEGTDHGNNDDASSSLIREPQENTIQTQHTGTSVTSIEEVSALVVPSHVQSSAVQSEPTPCIPFTNEKHKEQTLPSKLLKKKDNVERMKFKNVQFDLLTQTCDTSCTTNEQVAVIVLSPHDDQLPWNNMLYLREDDGDMRGITLSESIRHCSIDALPDALQLSMNNVSLKYRYNVSLVNDRIQVTQVPLLHKQGKFAVLTESSLPLNASTWLGLNNTKLPCFSSSCIAPSRVDFEKRNVVPCEVFMDDRLVDTVVLGKGDVTLRFTKLVSVPKTMRLQCFSNTVNDFSVTLHVMTKDTSQCDKGVSVTVAAPKLPLLDL